MRRFICFLFVFTLGVSFSGCVIGQPYASRNAFLLDTIITIKIYDRKVPENVWDHAFDEIKRLDAILSAHVEGSDPDRLKQSAGISPVTVSPETLEIIQKSIEYSRLSDGLFDITAGPLIDLWAIEPPDGHVPTGAELAATLPLIGWRDIEIDESASQVFLKRIGMSINLGAIAKGYIADRVKEVLVADGVEHAIVSLGGNIQLIGDTFYGVGIQDPGQGTGIFLGAIQLTGMSVASSGDYERYFEQDGIRYHHILDPKTGYPADTGLRGVSIVCPRSIDADALSTAVFLMGPADGMALVEDLPDTEAVLVTDEKTVLLSSGLKDIFELVKDSGYTIAQ
jgi:thiamine biosynthesis lipoprotein